MPHSLTPEPMMHTVEGFYNPTMETKSEEFLALPDENPLEHAAEASYCQPEEAGPGSPHRREEEEPGEEPGEGQP